MDDSRRIEAIQKEAKRLHEDVLYSEKSHFTMATIWGYMHYGLGVPAAITAALAGLSAINEYPIVAVVASIIATVLTSLMTFLDTEKRRSEHFVSGKRYAALRGDLRRMIDIDLLDRDQPIPDARARLQQRSEEKRVIQEASPHTGGIAYRLGKRSIKKGEHSYEADVDKVSA